MDVDMEDIEFDIKEVVDDVTMSDDELEKELKELEKENEVKSRDDENPQINVASMPEHVDGKGKGNHKRHHSKDKVSLKTFYDDLERGSKDRHEDTGNKRHFERCNRYKERTFDYKRLNRSLHISKNTDPLTVGREIASRLNEPKIALFGHIVRVLGQNTVSEIFAETKDLMKRGGIKTDKGDRVRSPGGTFLYIMKNRCYATNEQIKEIFKEDNEAKKQQRKKLNRQKFVHQGVGQNMVSENKQTHRLKMKVDLPCKGVISDGKEKGKEKCGKTLTKDASAATKYSVVNSEKVDEDSPKDITTCSGMKLKSEGCVFEKGTKRKELRKDITVDDNIRINKVDDEYHNESTICNVNTRELEEGEIVCNADKVTTELPE